MSNIKSNRAKDYLEHPRFFKSRPSEGMIKYPGNEFELMIGVIEENGIVKNLSFYGGLIPLEQVLLESWASIMIGKNLSRADQVSLRECEAFLRDRNSEPSIMEMPLDLEAKFTALFSWLKRFMISPEGKEYHFSSQNGPFRNLKLVDKVRELKGFLGSKEIIFLYEGLPKPTLLDVEDLTVYLEAPYGSEKEKGLFEKLHMRGVMIFGEESLNFVPEV